MCEGWAGLGWPLFNVGTQPTSFCLPPSRRLLLFPTCFVGPRTLTTWESCMQVRASSHTAVCHKQGSTVHDLRHAHRVQSTSCKTMPSVSFDKKPSSAWHITSLLPASQTQIPTVLPRGIPRGRPSDPSRRNCIKPHHRSHVRNTCPSQPLIPSPVALPIGPWGCHSNPCQKRVLLGALTPLPPSSNPTTVEAHAAAMPGATHNRCATGIYCCRQILAR